MRNFSLAMVSAVLFLVGCGAGDASLGVAEEELCVQIACKTGYHFDLAKCACVPNAVCIQVQCPPGKIWNATLCTCK